jgi:acetoacetate decarboxylase
MVPPFPFKFRDCRIMTLYWRTDPDAIDFLLPPPLKRTGDIACAHIYQMNDPDWIGPYGEMNVMVGAELPGKASGGYSPYLALSSDGGVVHGREVHGQPKKHGNPQIEVRGDLLVGSVERNGIDVLTGTMAYKQRAVDLLRSSRILILPPTSISKLSTISMVVRRSANSPRAH